MDPIPRQFASEYGAQFGDESIVAAYRFRPPYPDETFDVLADLLGAAPRTILDGGCGSGDLAIPLARIADRVDAVDPSAAMLAMARTRPGGGDPRIRWINETMENSPLKPPYGLITVGESLHWMDWPVVLARFRDVLARGKYLAIVEREELSNPWWTELVTIFAAYSTNRDFQSYNLVELLEERSLFRSVGSVRTAPVPVEQMIDDYVESIHSRNGFSRDRMTADAARAFDAEARQLLDRFASNDVIRFEVTSSVVWGKPAP